MVVYTGILRFFLPFGFSLVICQPPPRYRGDLTTTPTDIHGAETAVTRNGRATSRCGDVPESHRAVPEPAVSNWNLNSYS